MLWPASKGVEEFILSARRNHLNCTAQQGLEVLRHVGVMPRRRKSLRQRISCKERHPYSNRSRIDLARASVCTLLNLRRDTPWKGCIYAKSQIDTKRSNYLIIDSLPKSPRAWQGSNEATHNLHSRKEAQSPNVKSEFRGILSCNHK